MQKRNIKLDLLGSMFVKPDGTFDLDEALRFAGRIAGVCYDEAGYNHLLTEDISRTDKRVDDTLKSGHHSVYDHILLVLNIQNLPKILAMVLNNEKQYTTSEKSARYTKIKRTEGSIITQKEEDLYNKWLNIFEVKIKEKYANVLSDYKIKKLAQENARYLVTVFMPTEMIYSTSLRQINYIASFMEEYIRNAQSPFENTLAHYMNEFLNELVEKNVLEPRLMQNEKHRSLSLFTKNIASKKEYFKDTYSCTYKGSFAQLAQAHRHRTINYQMEMLDEKEYFVPPIIEDDKILKEEWLADMISVSSLTPQGELIYIHENGTYKNFILKCKERLCSAAQLEICRQTKDTLYRYKEELEKNNHYLQNDIVDYTHGARCTFKDYQCLKPCKFKEGITLERKI